VKTAIREDVFNAAFEQLRERVEDDVIPASGLCRGAVSAGIAVFRWRREQAAEAVRML